VVPSIWNFFHASGSLSSVARRPKVTLPCAAAAAATAGWAANSRFAAGQPELYPRASTALSRWVIQAGCRFQVVRLTSKLPVDHTSIAVFVQDDAQFSYSRRVAERIWVP
jgi:hypothetical protein